MTTTDFTIDKFWLKKKKVEVPEDEPEKEPVDTEIEKADEDII